MHVEQLCLRLLASNSNFKKQALGNKRLQTEVQIPSLSIPTINS